MRARYGVSFVNLKSDLYSALVKALESEICYTGLHYNSTQLYVKCLLWVSCEKNDYVIKSPTILSCVCPSDMHIMLASDPHGMPGLPSIQLVYLADFLKTPLGAIHNLDWDSFSNSLWAHDLNLMITIFVLIIIPKITNWQLSQHAKNCEYFSISEQP